MEKKTDFFDWFDKQERRIMDAVYKRTERVIRRLIYEYPQFVMLVFLLMIYMVVLVIYVVFKVISDQI